MAGINARKEPVSLELNLDFIQSGEAVVYSDGEGDALMKNTVSLKNGKKSGIRYAVTIPSEKGFVIVK